MVDTIKLDHVYRMTDDTGMLQHSRYSIPDRNHGYSTDDNSRALIMALALADITASSDPIISHSQIALAETYLGFMQHAQRADGWWRNFMDYSRRFIDDSVSQDCYGRCMLACSYATGRSIFGISDIAFDMFQKGLERIDDVKSPRAMAYTALAMVRYAHYSGWDEHLKAHALRLARSLCRLYDVHDRSGWHWFEDYITYCNGILPHALIAVGDALNDKEILRVGIDSLMFLIDNITAEGYLDIVGNNGWWLKGGQKALYDQQCVDAASMLWACAEAYDTTDQELFRNIARLCWEWFWGRNRSGMTLYDPETGGCYDGLMRLGINKNQGAESLISFLLSYVGAMHLELEQLPKVTISNGYIIR